MTTSLRSQATFASAHRCAIFSPNRLKPDMCTECYDKIFAHTAKAVHDDEMIRAALEYSNKGRKIPLLILNDASGGGHLYLGGFASVLNQKFLKAKNITGIVNTAKGLEMFGPRWIKGLKSATDSGIEVLELNWIDSKDQEISIVDLQKAVQFIRLHRSVCGGNVIVHCAQGKSRSTTVVLAYLMTLDPTLNVESALAFVQTKRMMALPNRHFLEQLRRHHQNDVFRLPDFDSIIQGENKRSDRQVDTQSQAQSQAQALALLAQAQQSAASTHVLAVSAASIHPVSFATEAATELLGVVDAVVQQCPWTAHKTTDQMVEYSHSELEEIKEAIENRKTQTSSATCCNTHVRSSDDLESEIGDLLFDALLLARICERDFEHVTLRGALERATEKITRRCPHVFAGERVETAAEASAIWLREKAKEKAGSTEPQSE